MNHEYDNNKNMSGFPEFYRYRPLWYKIIILPMAAVFLMILLLSLWLYNYAAFSANIKYARFIGPAVLFTGGFIIILSTFFVNKYLVRRLQKKRKSLYLMDRQLIKMSRLASDTQLFQAFFRELKDKLTNIDTATSYARDLVQKNKLNELDDTLLQIRSEVLHSHRKIAKLMAFTQAPGCQWLIHEIDVNQLLNDLLWILHSELFLKSIQVHKEFQDPLPRIRSNFSRLHQIFQNLFLTVMADISENSIITLKTSRTANGIRIVLSYPSLNFDKNVMKKIFDPSSNLQTTEPGPWLALCVHHVIRLNGSLEAGETSGNALSFTLDLPYRFRHTVK